MYHRIFIVGLLGALVSMGSSRLAAQDTDDDDLAELRAQLQQAEEPVALNRGPIHEAYAEPFLTDPEPGIIVPRRPPDPVNEIPPDVQPAEDVVWYPGYWGWDAELEEFIWVSGVWRKPPPYQRRVPGYWEEVEGGWQWVPGTWVTAEQQELEYLPEPPESLEAGPTSEAPSDQHIWVPGCWIWQQDTYAWRPGYWSMGYDDWVWMPDRYVWTPYGCIFARGYWDYPFVRRGWLFAPYFFPFHRPGFVFSPFTPLAFVHPGNVFGNFWVWPGFRHYFFGNYFLFAGRHPGFFPWHQFHGFRRGFHDPLFVHRGRMHPGGIGAFRSFAHRDFDRFARDRHLRPPHTMRDLDRFRGRVGRDAFDRAAFARPLREGIDRRELGAFRRLDEGRRREFAQGASRMRDFAGQRQQLERGGARALAERDRVARRPQQLGLPSTRMTELREARRPVEARRPDGRRPTPGVTRAPDVRRPTPGVTRAPDGRRPTPGVTRAPDGRRPTLGPERTARTPDVRRQATPGRTTPQVRPGLTRPTTPQFRGTRPTTPQFRGGTGRPTTPSFRGGTGRPTTPSFRGGGGRSMPSFRGGGGGRSMPSFRGGGGGRSMPSFRGGGGGRGGSPARGGGRGGGR